MMTSITFLREVIQELTKDLWKLEELIYLHKTNMNAK